MVKLAMRKKYNSDYKTKIVLELLREEMTVNQISSKYDVHRTQLNQWRKLVIDGIPELLTDGRKKDNLAKEHEEVVKDLYAQIGELTIKLNWLKKKSGIDV
jgi:transposase-like protein